MGALVQGGLGKGDGERPARRALIPQLDVQGQGGDGQHPADGPDVGGLKNVAREAARAAERAAILAVLERTRWNRLRTARVLGISYRALLYKLQAYGLTRPDRRARDSAA